MRVLRSLYVVAAITVILVGTPDAWGTASNTPEQGQGSSLHGFVVVGNGAPIPNASVTVEGTAGAQAATTNAAGEYTINGLGAGDCHIRISAAGFDSYEASVTLTTGNAREVDAVLFPSPKAPEPAPSPATQSAIPEQSPEGNTSIAPQQPAAPAQTVTAAAQALNVKAQKGKAALYGTANDQSGAVIQGATATATGPSGAVTVNANTLGQYVINGLAPGQYKLSVSAPGFAPFVTDVTVATDQALELDASLQLKGAVQEIEVKTGGPAEIQTENAQVEGTITQKEVLQTGLNGRNFTQLIALAPGVSNQTGQDEALVGVKGSVKYSVNGGRVEYNNFDVDGSDVLNAGLNGAESTLMVYPSLDGIQEVKVLTSNYGAQYGRSASGTVLVTTKSGTHDFHGVAYDFIRNEFFNSRNYFDQTSKAPLYRRQDFGGAIGGPLTIPGVFNTKRDKTFFFWSEEFRLEKTPQEFNQAVPTLSERTLFAGTGTGTGGNGCGQNLTCASFSDVCPLFGSVDRSKFPDCPSIVGGEPESIVPVSNVSQKLLSTGMIPLPNSPTGCNSSLAGQIDVATNQPIIPCYVAVISPSTYWREELGRFDHNFTQNVHLMARYIHDSWDTTEPTPLWGYVQNSFPTVQNRLNGPGTSMVARLTETINPKLLNEFVVSYVNAHITLRPQNGPGANIINQQLPSCQLQQPNPTANCINYIFPNNNAGGKPPGIVIAGTNGQYGGNGFTVDPSYAPWNHTNPTYSLSDDVGINVGRHTLHVGIQLIDAQRNETNGAIGSATGDLQGILTFSNQNSDTSGNAFADFLMTAGVADPGNAHQFLKSYQQDSAQNKYYNNYWVTEPYVQDDWRVTSRLTVNLGLRLSLFGNYHEKNDNAWNWVASKYTTISGYTIPLIGTAGGAGFLAQDNPNLTPVTLPSDLSFANLPPLIKNGLVQCGVNGVPSSCMSTHLFNPAPRVGFAWDPKGDGKTSIRGGYGVFFEHGTAKEANTGSLEGNSPLVLTMTDPFPADPTPYSLIGAGPNNSSLVYPIDVTSIPTKPIWPYVQQWSFSVQQQLPKDMVTTIAYVGSKGTHLNAELQINQLTPPPTGPNNGIFRNGNPYAPGQPIISGRADLAGIEECDYTGSGFGPTGGKPFVQQGEPAFNNMVAACAGTTSLTNGSFVINGGPDPNTLRPYFGFGRILSLQDIADSQYHAFQVTLRRTRGPLTIGVSYTFSHSLDDSSDRSDSTFVNSANIRSNWASSNFDQRHLLNFNYVYDLPKFARTFREWASYRGSDQTGTDPAPSGKNRDSGLAHMLLDGWQLSGITTFQSGTPFSIINGGSNNLGISVLDNAGIANGAGAGSYPDVVASPRTSLPSGINRFNTQSVGPLLYNPAAFAAPRGLTFGNAGRNFVTNPHRINFDMSGFKDFKITEGSTLEFRAEAFNVFNHTQFRIFNPNIGNSAQNTVSCYGGGLGGAPFTAAGGLTPAALTGNPDGQPESVDCTTGASFLRPIDAHRPRTIQLGLKYSF